MSVSLVVLYMFHQRVTKLSWWSSWPVYLVMVPGIMGSKGQAAASTRAATFAEWSDGSSHWLSVWVRVTGTAASHALGLIKTDLFLSRHEESAWRHAGPETAPGMVKLVKLRKHHQVGGKSWLTLVLYCSMQWCASSADTQYLQAGGCRQRQRAARSADLLYSGRAGRKDRQEVLYEHSDESPQLSLSFYLSFSPPSFSFSISISLYISSWISLFLYAFLYLSPFASFFIPLSLSLYVFLFSFFLFSIYFNSLFILFFLTCTKRVFPLLSVSLWFLSRFLS